MTAGLPVAARHRGSGRQVRALGQEVRGRQARGRIDVVGRVVRACRFARWYLGEISGEGDYRRYLAEFERLGGCAHPLSRRDFERRKMAEREGAVTNRCC